MDNSEQIKQKIAIEMEHARLWSIFLLPLCALSISLYFSDQYLVEIPIARFAFGTFALLLLFAVILFRNEHVRRVHSFIKEL